MPFLLNLTVGYLAEPNNISEIQFGKKQCPAFLSLETGTFLSQKTSLTTNLFKSPANENRQINLEEKISFKRFFVINLHFSMSRFYCESQKSQKNV